MTAFQDVRSSQARLAGELCRTPARVGHIDRGVSDRRAQDRARSLTRGSHGCRRGAGRFDGRANILGSRLTAASGRASPRLKVDADSLHDLPPMIAVEHLLEVLPAHYFSIGMIW